MRSGAMARIQRTTRIQRQAKPEAEAGAFQNNRGIFDI
jgi:hypothetical protein